MFKNIARNAIVQKKKTLIAGSVFEQEVILACDALKPYVCIGLQWKTGISQSLGKHFVWLINRIYRPLRVIT